MAIIKTNINEVEEVFAKLDLALICEEKYNTLKQFDWVVYAILKNQEGLSKRSYLMGNKSYVDKYNNVFVRISQKKLAKLLKTSIPTLRNSLNRLVEVELLEINVVGQNECNIMYIGNPVRTITFGEYIESIGKALEDEDNSKDFKPSINVDNVMDLENKKASTGGTVKATNTNKNNIDINSIPQKDKKDTKKENKKNTGKGASANVNNTFEKYDPKELENMLEEGQKGKFYKGREEDEKQNYIDSNVVNVDNCITDNNIEYEAPLFNPSFDFKLNKGVGDNDGKF